jgi:transcriptional regulator with XRE-family HTH domain
MGITQETLARRIGTASKAVIYQWESRKRTPSHVLWQRIVGLGGRPDTSALPRFERTRWRGGRYA